MMMIRMWIALSWRNMNRNMIIVVFSCCIYLFVAFLLWEHIAFFLQLQRHCLLCLSVTLVGFIFWVDWSCIDNLVARESDCCDTVGLCEMSKILLLLWIDNGTSMRKELLAELTMKTSDYLNNEKCWRSQELKLTQYTGVFVMVNLPQVTRQGVGLLRFCMSFVFEFVFINFVFAFFRSGQQVNRQ